MLLEPFHRLFGVTAISAQAEVYRSAILDALAHEFKTPLATILTAVGGLREAGILLTHTTLLQRVCGRRTDE
jgi:K+-sensing histidine kinase KdpD